MTSPCATCPVGNPDCIGLEIPRLCELARSRADYADLVRHWPRGSAPAASVPAPAFRPGMLLVLSCPYGGPIKGGCCGERRRDCYWLSKRPGEPLEVGEDVCLECVSGRWPIAPVGAGQGG